MTEPAERDVHGRDTSFLLRKISQTRLETLMSLTQASVDAAIKLCVMLVLLLVPVAHGYAQQPAVEVKDAWARGTVPAQKASGAFMEIRSNSPAQLLGAASPVASHVEIHNMKMEDGVMRMFAVKSVELPAGKPVKFAPGGYHIMLMGLK